MVSDDEIAALVEEAMQNGSRWIRRKDPDFTLWNEHRATVTTEIMRVIRRDGGPDEDDF